MPQFLENWVEDKARQRVLREMSVIESEWPAHTGSACASGYLQSVTTESCPLLLSVPSSRWFKPRMLWVCNNETQYNKILLYTGGSNTGAVSATIGEFWLGPREAQFLAIDCITVGGDIHVSALTNSISLRIAGILLNSGPE